MAVKKSIAIIGEGETEWYASFSAGNLSQTHILVTTGQAADEEIDQRAFELYGLTEEERRIEMES